MNNDSSGAPASPSGSTLQPPVAASASIPSAHTPGPWFVIGVNPWSAGGSHVQWGEYRISAGSTDDEADNYYRIGSVSNVNGSPANEANALVMAAALDMLSALQAISDALPSDEFMRAQGQVPGPGIVMMRAAIAKATGG